MPTKPPKLIIWDFDGVIADTESLWIRNLQQALKDVYHLEWDLPTVIKHFGGVSHKTSCARLKQLGYEEQEQFWQRVQKLDELDLQKGFYLTEGILPLLKDPAFSRCIATGDSLERTIRKNKVIGIENLFNEEQIFTASMVQHGKPEPDIFLLAAEKMGYQPKDCIVIEDSAAGLAAAAKAGMTAIAFIKYAENRDEITSVAKQLRISRIAAEMIDVQTFLKEYK